MDFTPEDSIYPQELASYTDTGTRFLRETQHTYPIKSPADAAFYVSNYVFHPFEIFTQEELWVLMLNTKMIVTHDAMVFRGTINSSPVRLSEIFRPAILCNSAAIIVAHNHPSGDPMPSIEDLNATQHIVQAGAILDIVVADHLVIGHNTFVSLREQKLGFGT